MVAITDESTGVSQLLGSKCLGFSPKVYAYSNSASVARKYGPRQHPFIAMFVSSRPFRSRFVN